jgi:hypothetical protein
LAAVNIDTRRWWGRGAHAHPATVGFLRNKLPVTDILADAAIGVPFYRDLEVADIRHIADAIVSSLAISGFGFGR